MSKETVDRRNRRIANAIIALVVVTGLVTLVNQTLQLLDHFK